MTSDDRSEAGPSGAEAAPEGIADHWEIQADLHLKELAFQGALTPIGITDRQSRIVQANAAFVRTWGYDSPAEIVGRVTDEFVCQPDVLQEIRQAVAERGTWTGRITARRKNGETFEVLASTSVTGHDAGADGPYAVTSFADISEQLRADQALQASEQQYRDLVENVQSIIVRLDGTGRITFLNRYAEEFLGLADGGILGQPALGTIIPERDHRGPDGGPMAAECLEHPQQYPANETEHSTRDGRRVWVSWTNRATHNEAGELVAVLCVGTDVTARRQAEEEARTRQAAVHSTMSAIGIAALDGTITYVNPAYLKLYGLQSADQVVGTHMDRYFETPERAQRVKAALLATGHWTGEGVALRADGGVPMQVVANVVRDEQGQPICLMASFLDITAQHQAAEALAAEKERLAVTLRSIADAVIATDIHGNVTLVNQAAELLTGWTQQEAIGKPASELFQVLDRQTRQPRAHPVYEALVTGQITRIRGDGIVVSRRRGEALIQDTAAPIFAAAGEMIGVVLVFRDTTEHEQLRDETYRTHRLESLGILAGGIAHDFNNLLTGLVGQLGVTRRRLDPLSRAHEELGEAEKAALRARHLTQQLLTFASGGSPIKRVLSLRHLVMDMVDLAASGKAVPYHVDLPEDLPAVEADEGQLSQAVNNLLLNALEATPEGGSVRVSGRGVRVEAGDKLPLPAGEYIQLTIRDEGPGIPPEVIDRIFDPYFTTKEESSGLGLTIAYSVVRKHGGHLAVTSDESQGAIFEVYLPASDSPAPVEPEEAREEEDAGSGRILVMDDDAMIRKVASTILRHHGYEVALASDGAEAVAMFRAALEAGKPYDGVILDLTVRGGLGGREAVSQLRALQPGVRALACSGYSNDPVMADSEQYGFCGIVVKPYRSQDLAEAVSHMLRRQAGKR